VRGREGERETERETERQRDRGRERQRERETDRETETVRKEGWAHKEDGMRRDNVKISLIQ
jgi:hypothetical protein